MRLPTPRWILHIQRYPGGISNGVRAMVSAEAMAARAAARQASVTGASASFGPNVQMNNDSSPPLPQNETAAAVSLANPKIAVAAANDYVSGGNVVMRTADGGRHWKSTRVTPFFDGTRDPCNGGDPSVAYSRRDHVFYMGQLCFFRTLPFSEVQIYVSRDNGRTWTPGRAAAIAATNFNYTTGQVNTSIFNDKDYIAVNNTPTSPHYGRLYVGYTKFHMLASGFSDYCPLQLAYTDTVNMANPTLTTFHHTAIQPDNPGGNGLGRSANQYFTPQVEPDGSLDVAFMQEACNTSVDAHVLFQRSTDGGQSFLPHAVQVDKPGQYKDFIDPAKDDTLPPTAFRAPNTPSLAFDARTGSLTFLYQNNINRPVSKADISFQRSTDGGQHWSNARFLSVNRPGAARAQRPVLPLGRRDRRRPPVRDLARPPARPGQRQHQHLGGPVGQRRGQLDQPPDQHPVLEPQPRVLQQRSVHRRLQRHRGQPHQRLPGLDRRAEHRDRPHRHRRNRHLHRRRTQITRRPGGTRPGRAGCPQGLGTTRCSSGIPARCRRRASWPAAPVTLSLL